MNFHCLLGQQLEGKWLLTNPGDTYFLPAVPILEFQKDSVKHYDFDTPLSSDKYRTEGNLLIIIPNGTVREFEFINENRLKTYNVVKLKEKDTVIELEYVRLLPTKTSLTKKEIAKLEFELDWNGKRPRIAFEDKKRQSGLQKYVLEKMDSTYLISLYSLESRIMIIPVKEVSQNLIVLYGTPAPPYEITGKKVP